MAALIKPESMSAVTLMTPSVENRRTASVASNKASFRRAATNSRINGARPPSHAAAAIRWSASVTMCR